MSNFKRAIDEQQAALEVLDAAFLFFNQNRKFTEELNDSIIRYVPLYATIPEGILAPKIYQFAEIDVMTHDLTDLVNSGLFHYVIYKFLLNDFSGGKRR